MTEPKRAAIYARVSTKAQNPDTQLEPLRRYAADRGFTAKEYVDRGYSGATNRRPALDAIMADVRARRVDVIICWRFDRFARSVRHLVNALAEFRHLGVGFVSLTEQIDLASPLGEAMFAIISALAQLERDIIGERVRAGLDRARAAGTRLGRPTVGISPARVLAAFAVHRSVRQTATALRVSASTVQRLLKEGRKEQSIEFAEVMTT